MGIVDTSQIGFPVPVGWEVAQLEVPHPNGLPGQTKMLVKLMVSTPSGLNCFFFDGDEAQHLGAAIKSAGKSAVVGIWTPDKEVVRASNGSRSALAPEGPQGPSSAPSGLTGG
jgi:hypothetical protein